MMGRVTLNPFKHIDPFGTILLPLILVLISSPIVLGAAKPVPVRFDKLRNPKRDMIWVALAGPGANFVQAFLWGAALTLLAHSGFTETDGSAGKFLLGMCNAGVFVNVVMFAFNLFPLPPLDGGRILIGLLPNKQAWALSRVEPYTLFIFLGMVMLSNLQLFDLMGVFSAIWMTPVSSIAFVLLKLLLSPLALLLS